jgi:hypothetical protein
MIKLALIIEQSETGQFYDWTQDFDVFKRVLNTTTEAAKAKFQTALGGKIKNKSVLVRASKGYKQPVKDYTINRVTSVDINDFYDDWVVVIKNENNKEFFLTAGYKIKVLGGSVAAEPGAATAPAEPEPVQSQPPTANQQPGGRPTAPAARPASPTKPAPTK